MHYGIYRNIREGAWRCLEDFKVASLPVDVLQIARRSGVKTIKNSQADLLNDGETGRAMFDGELWVIVYDDKNSTAVARYTLAHELGHIFLGHDLTYENFKNVKEFRHTVKSEEQADSFAIRLLCPACVLKGLDIHTAEEIEKYCGVESRIARQRMKRMELLYKRNKFFTSELEERVYENFHMFIQDELFKRENSKTK